jgi:hypothetical protein
MKTIFTRFSVLTIAFLFFNCSSDSTTPCIPIICKNGGASTPDCGCNCPQGYTGSDCSTQITPTKITITKIRVKYFPNSTTTGNYWDVSLGTVVNANPDIYLTLQNSSLSEIYRSPTYYRNALSDGITYFDFVPAIPISITSVSSAYILNLWDYDSADSNINDFVDDDMGFVAFKLYNTTGGFPSTITVLDSSKSLGFELSITYTW